jgi:hypothetical protein
MQSTSVVILFTWNPGRQEALCEDPKGVTTTHISIINAETVKVTKYHHQHILTGRHTARLALPHHGAWHG